MDATEFNQTHSRGANLKTAASNPLGVHAHPALPFLSRVLRNRVPRPPSNTARTYAAQSGLPTNPSGHTLWIVPMTPTDSPTRQGQPWIVASPAPARRH